MRGREQYICSGCINHCLMDIPEGEYVPYNKCHVKGGLKGITCFWNKVEKQYMMLIDDNMG